MQIGNPQQLKAERHALRDAFDAIWIHSEVTGPKELRAIRCAMALDVESSAQSIGHGCMFPGGKWVGYAVLYVGSADR